VAVGDPAGSDFNGDGIVNLTDFFLFAEAFGQPPEGELAIFDVSRDGAINLTDFFLFTEVFGLRVSGRIVPGSLPVVPGRFDLTARSTAEHLVVELHSVDAPLRGYAAVVDFDPSQFRLLEVVDANSQLRDGHDGALLLTEPEDDRVTLAGSRAGGTTEVDGLLAELWFAPLSPDGAGWFRIQQGVVHRGSGQLAEVESRGQIDARWVPTVFALSPNFPNPFNPATTIGYQLPVDSPTELVIYDVLGQKIRTLVDDVRPAGAHRVQWHGDDDHGRSVAAGVYFYRLQAGDFRQVNKLLLLK
jgi:hypothetical protein